MEEPKVKSVSETLVPSMSEKELLAWADEVMANAEAVRKRWQAFANKYYDAT